MITFSLNHCSNELLKAMAEESRSAENLKQLLEFNEALLYKVVAANEYTDKETLKYLYNKYKDQGEVCYALAENRSTPQEILHEIAIDCNYTIARLILTNDELKAEDITAILELHIKDQRIVRGIVAHPNTAAADLIKISDKHPDLICNILNTGKVKLTES